jgi:hypothetical protein
MINLPYLDAKDRLLLFSPDLDQIVPEVDVDPFFLESGSVVVDHVESDIQQAPSRGQVLKPKIE